MMTLKFLRCVSNIGSKSWCKCIYTCFCFRKNMKYIKVILQGLRFHKDNHLPDTTVTLSIRLIDSGLVLTWHSYSPWSLNVTLLSLKVQAWPSGVEATENRLSGVCLASPMYKRPKSFNSKFYISGISSYLYIITKLVFFWKFKSKKLLWIICFVWLRGTHPFSERKYQTH